MKLLFIFTGGTIGSAISGDYIRTDENKPNELIKTYETRYGLDHLYDSITPYTELSEQNSGSTISGLIQCVYDIIHDDECTYDGIIVTHGTDTLPYSAAALSYALGNNCIPVCFVSSNYPITDERANGVDNLYGAIKLFESDTMRIGEDGQSQTGRNHNRGVFVSYRNHDGITYIHRGTRLLEASAFSDEYFSVAGQYYGKIENGRFEINENYHENEDNEDKMQPFGKIELADISDSIMRFRPYPGMPYIPIDPTITDEKSLYIEKMLADMNILCILHESYHSGTINTKLTEYHTFFETAAKMEIPVFLTGVSRGVAYESTNVYGKLHFIPVYNISPAALYVKMWMLLSHSMMIARQAFSMNPLFENTQSAFHNNIMQEEYRRCVEIAIRKDIPLFRGECLPDSIELINTSLGGDIFYV